MPSWVWVCGVATPDPSEPPSWERTTDAIQFGVQHLCPGTSINTFRDTVSSGDRYRCVEHERPQKQIISVDQSNQRMKLNTLLIERWEVSVARNAERRDEAIEGTLLTDL